MKPVLRSIVTVFACASVVACGGAKPRLSAKVAPPAPEAGSKADKPFDLKAALAREGSGLTAHKVDAGGFQAEVLASKPPTVKKEDGFWTLEIEIGSEQHVECFVYAKMIDPGFALSRFTNLLEGKDNLSLEQVAPTALLVIDETPALFLEAQYTTPLKSKTPGVPSFRVAAGSFKVAVFPHETHPISCAHDEVGYAKTFASVLESLAMSISGMQKPAAARLVEITQVNVDDRIVGFEYGRLREVEGGLDWFEQSVAILPRSKTELVFSDSATYQKLDDNGILKLGQWTRATEGKVEYSVKVQRKAGSSKYSYDGEAEGKKVSGELATKNKRGLEGNVSTSRAFAKALASKKALELKEESYTPSVDATKAVETRYKLSATGELSATTQKLRVVGKVTPEGRFESWELSDKSVRAKRIFGRGAP